MGKMDVVVPEKHTLKKKFKFRCHKDIKCFTHCCSDIEILLTPYDVVNLKKKLGISSSEFLDTYTHMKIDEKSSHPYAIMKMSDDDKKRCIFVTDEGCSVYSHRPANCRYYPVGQGTLKKESKGGTCEEEFYFFIKEPHCYGYHEKKNWTIESWRKNQEIDRYDEINKEWKGLLLRKNLPGHAPLDESKQFQFYMASYDLDSFRKYIFESNFLNVFDVEEETVEKIRNDDVALIQFGVRYIKYIMMIDETLKMKKGAERYRKKK